MKYLLLILFIPAAFAGSPPNCGELGRIIQEYEKDLQKKFITNCRSVNHQTLVENIPVKDPHFLEGKVCSDLATVESELERLKAEEAVLTGFNKLKSVIQKSQQDSGSRNPAAAGAAGKTFVGSLNTAQSMEVLLSTVDSEERALLPAIKAKLGDSLTQLQLSEIISELCKDEEKTNQNACNPNVFKPGPEATAEIYNLLKNNSLSKEQLAGWKENLSIKRKTPTEDGKTDYSFTEMQNALGDALSVLDSNAVLSKDQLKAIYNLDQFESRTEFSFVKNLAELKEKKELKLASDKFFLLMGDAKKRQEYEIQSKTSLIWSNSKAFLSALSEQEKADCEMAKAVVEKARQCLAGLQREVPKVTDARFNDDKANLIERLMPAVKNSLTYMDSLSGKLESCEAELKSNGALSESCYAEMNHDLASVQDKILQLNLLKDKIGQENTDLMKFRNLALMKWGDQKCQKVDSAVDFCEENTSISKEAMMTISDSMEIAVLFSPKPEALTEAEELCSDEERSLKKNEERLCEFFNDTTSNIVESAVKTPEVMSVEAPDGNHQQSAAKDAWIQAGASILGNVLNHYSPKAAPPPAVNPYPYNYAPHNNGAPPMGIADSILFNARFHGAYGFYMPTPGFQPYTAFGAASPLSAYRPASTGRSAYFGN